MRGDCGEIEGRLRGDWREIEGRLAHPEMLYSAHARSFSSASRAALALARALARCSALPRLCPRCSARDFFVLEDSCFDLR